MGLFDKFRKKKDQKEKWFSADSIGMQARQQMKAGSVPELKYPIETFPSLSAEEADEMDAEWYLTSEIITDSFYRFLPFTVIIDIDGDTLYNVYVEIRYEIGRPDLEGLRWVADEADDMIEKIEKSLRDKGQIDYELIRTEMKAEIGRLMEQRMPDVVISEILVEPVY